MGKFTPEDARAFYDSFGAKQDLQAFYENPAINDLIAHAAFEKAHAVFEFGFGTGSLAELLLSHHLPPDALYTGIDISATMARLAEVRLQPWRERVAIKVADGTRGIDLRDGSFDRFVSAYVLDLLSTEDIRSIMHDAYRMLEPGGRLCLLSLTRGITAWGRLVTGVWETAFKLRPQLVGGCRPVELLDYLIPERWRVEHRNSISSFGITSEIVVASRIQS
jgi:ubiquinone/menaquinone biosynthesis C-methylase UbiE